MRPPSCSGVLGWKMVTTSSGESSQSMATPL